MDDDGTPSPTSKAHNATPPMNSLEPHRKHDFRVRDKRQDSKHNNTRMEQHYICTLTLKVKLAQLATYIASKISLP